MPRTPEELFAEIAAWPLEERLALLARLLTAVATELASVPPSQPPRSPAVSPGSHGEAASNRESTGGPRSQVPSVSTAGNRVPRPPRPSPAPGAAAVAAAGAATPKAADAGKARRLVLIDGSNFLGTVPGFDLSTESARDELVTRLQDFAHAHPALRVVVYFDGRKTSVKRAGGVEVRFSPGQRPADYYLLESLRALAPAERHRALLVTADRALADAASKLGAKVEAPSSFHHRLPGPRRTAVGERGLSPAEVADWEAYFQQPPERGSRG